MKSPLKIVFGMLLLAVLACNAGADVSIQADGEYTYLSASLTEQQVQDVLVNVLGNTQRIQVRDARADLQAGQIVVTGTLVTADGRQFPGSMTLLAAAANGALQITVQSVNFNGFTAEQATLDRWNADIAAGLNRVAAQTAAEVTEVSVTTTELKITWRRARQ
jgi:hypothetical protein